ncbi:MAG: GNAT family protein [Actinobacteria bacterium]|nr:GNAT family protein [Actinomycetota bacterium]
MTALTVALMALTLVVHHRAGGPSQAAAGLGRAEDDLTVVAAITTALVAALTAVRWIDTVHRPPSLINGERVVLRPIGRWDGPEVARTIDQVVLDENRWPPDSAERMKRLARRGALSNDAAIFDASTDDIVGVVSLIFDDPRRTATLGIWIGPDHRGSGYGSDAIGAAARLAHGLGYGTTALTSPTNAAVHRALERAGFVRTGTVEHVFATGEAIDAIRFEHRGTADPG